MRHVFLVLFAASLMIMAAGFFDDLLFRHYRLYLRLRKTRFLDLQDALARVREGNGYLFLNTSNIPGRLWWSESPIVMSNFPHALNSALLCTKVGLRAERHLSGLPIERIQRFRGAVRHRK